MKTTISARETSGNAKKTILMCVIDPVNKSITAPSKPTFITICKILDAGKVEIFVEGRKVRNIAPEKIPDDMDEEE
jgi:hypothetical protein